jgi:hypothetical protein
VLQIGILTPWAASAHEGDPEAAHAAAREASSGALLVCGGFISQMAVYGDGDVERYLTTIRSVVGD